MADQPTTEGSVEYSVSAYSTPRKQASSDLQTRIKSRLHEAAGEDYAVDFNGNHRDVVTYDGGNDEYICSASFVLAGDHDVQSLFHDADTAREHHVDLSLD